MRSLIHYCYDITVPRPTTDQIKGAILRIACSEGLSIPPNALEEMIVASNHDVRQVIHNISMWTANKKTLSFEEAKENAQNSKKVTAMGPFDVIRNVFARQNTKSNPVDEKLDLYFQDYSFGPLFVQENYPLIRPFGAKGDPLRHLELLALTADSLSTSDIISKRIRGAQNWKLLPMEGFFSTVYPGELLQGNFTGKIEFPKWFGNNSKSNKYQRIVGELCTHTRLHTSGSAADVTMDYIPSWYQKVTRAIVSEQIQEAAGFLCEYELLKDDWDSIAELGLYSGHRDVMSQVAPKVKAQLTRITNKERGTLHYKVDQSFRKLKVKQDDEFGDLDADDEIIGTEESEDLSQNQMIQRKTVAPSTKKKPAAKKSTQKPKKSNKK
ncbi:Replication factor C subunit 1 [Oopsacas minuta]|uniref:Activator 1 large subunit n=1 Tax=Oopsacas minuta TaxID=111878 RepID=A0AAV7JKG9_9METZ|nr:Replication factor C subunit 1 [Oopsacas minuta]